MPSVRGAASRIARLPQGVRRRAAPGQKIGRGRRRANAPSAARREVRTNARGELDAYSSVAGLAGQGDIGLAPLTRSPVIDFHVLGLPEEISRTVRDSMLAPEYGHPAIREIARGTGPCRTCLNVFRVGEEERLLFTYRPAGEEGTLGAPGPVFIHARPCRQFRGSEFPQGLRTLPLFIEGRASGNRILMARRATGPEIDDVLRDLLGDAQVDYLHVRHGEAGCYITRVSRGPIPRAIPGPISTVSRKVRPSVRNRLAQLQPALVAAAVAPGEGAGTSGTSCPRLRATESLGEFLIASGQSTE